MTVWTHFGNCPKFTFTPKPEKLKHYSSMAGAKLLDETVLNSLEAELEMDADEFIEDNLILGLLASTVSSGESLIGGAAALIQRQVKLTGTNNVGARFELILPRVSFSSDKAISFIGDAWGSIPLTGDVLLSDFSGTKAFGSIVTLSSPTGAPTTAPNPINYFLGKGNVYTAPVGT